MTPPIPLFPSSPALGFTIDSLLQGAVAAALAELIAARKNPISFSLAIIDLGDGSGKGTLKCGAHKPGEVHYNASAVKVAAMYAAYALRDMVRRFWAVAKVAQGAGAIAGLVGGKPPAKQAPLFDLLRAKVDPAIDAGAPALLKAVGREQRVPHYEKVFFTPSAGSWVFPEFRGDFKAAMHDMIVPSDNDAAGRTIRGVGYGYLNGALAAAGLFNEKKDAVVWLAGDYVGIWPYARINSANDKAVAQAGSALGMAQMLALIVNRGVIDSGACDEMRALLAEAAKGVDVPFLTRSGMDASVRIPLAKVTHCKLGLGPLKQGGDVLSEIFRLEGLHKPGKNYAVAYQNLNENQSSLYDVAFMVQRSLAIYEA